MNAMGDLHKAFACSVPYLRLWGAVAGGWQMARAAAISAGKIAAGDSEADFYRAKLATAAFYATHVLSQCAWYQRQIVDGSGDVMALSDEQFALGSQAVAVTAFDRHAPRSGRASTRAEMTWVKLITLDNPPVNALSFAYCAKLYEAIEDAHADDSVEAIVFTGANGLFSGGADVNDFNSELPAQARTIRDVIRAVELSIKPHIAAIDGVALGGGLELALACDYRIATPRSKLGLPEIKLGLLPGAGGTQRLPRLIGARAALEFMLKGSALPAARVLELGILDEIVEGDVVERAISLATRFRRNGGSRRSKRRLRRTFRCKPRRSSSRRRIRWCRRKRTAVLPRIN